MTPYFEHDGLTLHHGDAVDVLAEIPAESVDLCVTSPPFFALRDYGTGSWEGGDADCDHRTDSKAQTQGATSLRVGRTNVEAQRNQTFRHECAKCGAARIDQQVGLERTPDDYVARLVEVFQAVRRVLKPTGNLLLEMGDSYSAGPRGKYRGDSDRPQTKQTKGGTPSTYPPRPVTDLPGKNLMGIPWKVAFALQRSGWILRGDYIWSRPNPMPSSAKDRCTISHSTVFHFSKAKWVGPEPGRFAHLSETDARWLAAMLDTEGCILVRRSKRSRTDNYSAQITITNTSEAILAEVRRIVGDVGSLQEKPVEDGRKRCYTWSTSSRVARDVLLAVYPYLIAKRDQARLAILAQSLVRHHGSPKGTFGGEARRPKSDSERLERCWLTSKALNQGEDVDTSWIPEPGYGNWQAQPYFWDAEAIAEEAVATTYGNWSKGHHEANPRSGTYRKGYEPAESRNARSVWTITTEPSGVAICPSCRAYWPRNAPERHCGVEVVQHFAAFPSALPDKAIRAATSEWGVCAECGAPAERIVLRESVERHELDPSDPRYRPQRYRERRAHPDQPDSNGGMRYSTGRTLGWKATCEHTSAEVVPAVVLDPFAGSGTTLLAARKLGRHCIGVELSDLFCEIAARRLEIPEAVARAAETAQEPTQLVIG